ncbi:hypothetical protein [Streptomyces sp. NBC_01304]|uniref:hypothetical protein n=1 Tax=Streptomyces sp. NBC_01304 TaxID=2903818 RepID=UPI002E16453E|nr:hypothetical protein OG430_15285 [Streptomyces sp. NBC_01304]
MAQQPQNPKGPNPDRGVLDEALDPEQIRSLNKSLRSVADIPGASPELQDMAKKLLSGQVSLRDSLDDPSGARALGSGLAGLRGQWEQMSDEEREQIRLGEMPPGGEVAPGQDEQERRQDRDADQSKKKGQGRHSGGFSLY